MLKKRIIPTLLWKNFTLVKWIWFDSSRRIWSIMQSIKLYNMREVDELIILDISSTLTWSEINYTEFKDFCIECNIPITMWWWIQNIEQVKRLIYNWADKISLNSILYTNPNIIREIATIFWSQAIVASIDVKKNDWNYICYSHSWTKEVNIDLFDHIKNIEKLWAWEILITSIEKDWTMSWYDLDLIEKVSKSVNVPVICSWWCWNYEDMYLAFSKWCSAVSASSIFHFTEQTPLEAKKYLKNKWLETRI